jgi:site-specific recombinase XerD
VTALAPVLEGFFTDRLHALRASEHTIAGYRDTYRLLLRFVHERTGRQPSQLDLSELDATLIGAFLDHLETDRANTVATRNVRMAAIRALFRYAALRCPEHAELIQRVLAIPTKRGDRQLVTFLTRIELTALLAAPDQTTALGRRDYLLLAVAIQTGLRVSELTGLTCADAVCGTGAHVRCTGKGRRERITPLTKPLARELARWLTERHATFEESLFPTARGDRLSNDAVQRLLAKHLAVAAKTCPSLATKHVTPHTLRHSCAMNLLQAGIDTSSISLWLGHANTRSTQAYLHADLTMKERALALTAPPQGSTRPAKRYRPPDRLLAFLEAL